MSIQEYLRRLVLSLPYKAKRDVPCWRVEPAGAKPVHEGPPFPVRWWVLLFGLAVLLVGGSVVFFVGNPVARVRDLRHGTRYDAVPLTSMAASSTGRQVWIGSAGGGIKIYDAANRLFAADVTRVATKQALLSDHVPDLSIGPEGLAAIVVSPGPDQAGGVQIASTAGRPRFWPDPLVGLDVFPGLNDTNASAVAQTSDERWLAVGTHGAGLGLYDVEKHRWRHVLTTRDGLASDFVNDLATAATTAPGGESVVWVATDHGLCGGEVSPGGDFRIRWFWNRRSGLAGDRVVRLTLGAGALWYGTAGHGMGRVGLNPDGTPVTDHAHQSLVTERCVPGLNDSTFQMAAACPVGPSTWFVASLPDGTWLGRYREMPHDTAGVRLPPILAPRDVTCLAPDMRNPSHVLVGSTRGVWYYVDTASDTWRNAASSNAVAEQVADLAGGCVGLENRPIEDLALAEPLAAARLRGQEHALLTRSTIEPAGTAWTWRTLVGESRFPMLTSVSNLTCAVRSPKRHVYFGTLGRGIGAWDRENLEVRRVLHSGNAEEGTRLRQNTTISLAVTEAGTLVQVAGDYGVDAFDGKRRIALAPTNGAPFDPRQAVCAAAQGTRLVAASPDAVGLYDMETFGWRTLPALRAPTQLALSDAMVWALGESGSLRALDVLAPDAQWRDIVAGHVVQIAAARDRIHAILRPAGLPGRLVVFDARNARQVMEVASLPLRGGEAGWRFAATLGQDLYLGGGGAQLHRYVLATRQWTAVDCPGAVAPWRDMAQSGRAIWIVDGGGALHRYDAGQAVFAQRLAADVARLACGTDGALVRIGTSTGKRLLWFPEEGVESRVIVGRRFVGDLAQVKEAVEFGGDLVVAQGRSMGIYDWQRHDWEVVEAPLQAIETLYASTDALWVKGSAEDAGRLLAWSPPQFLPVKRGEEDVRVEQAAVDASRLCVLTREGRVLSVAANAPVAASTLLNPTAVADVPAEGPAVEKTVPLDGYFVTAAGQAIHVYGPAQGVAEWASAPSAGGRVERLVRAVGEASLLALTPGGVWSLKVAAGRSVESTPLFPDIGLPGGTAFRSMADDARGVVCAVRGEADRYCRVFARSRGAFQSQPIVGEALRATAATRTVVAVGENELLRLDAAGAVGSYELGTRGWRAENPPFPLDALWASPGPSAIGYSGNQATLVSRARPNAWNEEAVSRGQVALAAPDARGVLAWLKDGTLLHWSGEGRPQFVRRPPPQGGGLKSRVAHAVEADDLLVLMGAGGELAAHDWRAQRWLKLDVGAALQLVRDPSAKGVFVLSRASGAVWLHGPLRRALADGALGAPAIESPSPLSRIAVNATGLYAAGQDRAVYRNEDGRMRRWWGASGLGRGVSLQGCPVLDARADAEGRLRLVLVESGTNLFTLTTDPASLESRIAPLIAGKPERWLRRGENESLAVVATANRRVLIALATGERISVLPPGVAAKDLAVVGTDVYLPHGQALARLSDRGTWDPEPPLTYRLPSGTNGVVAIVTNQTPIVALAGVGDVLVCRTSPGVLRLRRGADLAWSLQESQEPSAGDARAAGVRPGVYGGFDLRASSTGAWRDGWSGARLDLSVRGEGGGCQVRPSRTVLALAHERVLDVAATEDGVYAATEDGLAMLTPSHQGAPHVTLIQESQGLPRGAIAAVRALPDGQIACRVESQSWHRRQAGGWRQDETLAAKMADGTADASTALENWRLPIGGAEEANVLERRFGDGTWARVRVEATGFDYERAYAAEFAEGTLSVYTAAGVLDYVPGQEALGAPVRFRPCQAPDDAVRGRHGVVRTPEGDALLSASPFAVRLAGTRVLADHRWRAPQGDEIERIRRLENAPALQDARWDWPRTASPGAERVTWRANPAALPLVSDFQPAVGRFGWDRCRGVGRAGGGVWMLTDAGLLACPVGGGMPTTCVTLPEGADGWTFADVATGDAGALRDERGALAMVWDGMWKPVSSAASELVERIRAVRAEDAHWRVMRDGQIRRARPQKSAAWDSVRWSQGGWTFERVRGVATFNGVCYAASDGGLLALNPTAGGLSAFWGDVGPARLLRVTGPSLLARLADNRILALTGESWTASSVPWPVAPDRVEGRRWAIGHGNGGLRLEARRQAAGALQGLEIADGDFAFDRVADAYPMSGQEVTLSTGEGLCVRGSEGDLAPVSAAANRRETFQLVADAPAAPGASTPLYGMGDAGTFLRHAGAWTTASRDDARMALERRQAFRTRSKSWQVLAGADGALRIGLCLPLDNGAYKPVTFLPDKGVFGFDDLRCVAALGTDSLAVGSAEGAQGLDGQGVLQRLWCVDASDGLSAERVDGAVADTNGHVIVATAKGCYEVPGVGERFRPVAETAYAKVCGLLATDRNGWRVERRPDRTGAFTLAWRGQRATLLPSGVGRHRFAHNVVYSVAVVNHRIVLGTAGGLVRLDSATPDNPRNPVLRSEPVDEAGDRPLALGAVLQILDARADNAAFLRVQRRDGVSRVRLDVERLLDAGLPAVEEADWHAAAEISRDDLLVWRAPDVAKVDVRYAPAKSVPEGASVSIADGTFTFLELDRPGAATARGTLAATPEGLYWLTRDGIVQYDPETESVVKVYREAAGGSGDLRRVDRLRWRSKDGFLDAVGTGRRFRFLSLSEGWEPIAATETPEAESVVTDGDLMVWRTTGKGVTVAMKKTDAAHAPCFGDGKPLLDVVHDFALAGGGDEAVLWVGCGAGVARYAAAAFWYGGLQTAPSRGAGGSGEAIVRMAAGRDTAGRSRVVCRAAGGRSWELVDANWTPADNVDEVFESGYRRVSSPDRWAWSRYPQGLTCELRMVNGDRPFGLGAAVRPDRPPIFSRGKLAFDDVRAVERSTNGVVLLATPVGIARYRLDAAARGATFEGVDVWATADADMPMLALSQSWGDGQTVSFLGSNRVFTCSDTGHRRWAATGTQTVSALRDRRAWRKGSEDIWTIERVRDDVLRIGRRPWPSGEWYVPARGALGDLDTFAAGPSTSGFAPAIRRAVAAVFTPDGDLWFLADNQLYRVALWRSHLHWVRSLAARQ